MGVLLPGYKRSSAENGMIRKFRRVLMMQNKWINPWNPECPTCHLAFFTSEHIVLSPPPQVLKYIAEYLWQTNIADRKPLHEVCFHLTSWVLDYSAQIPIHRFFAY